MKTFEKWIMLMLISDYYIAICLKLILNFIGYNVKNLKKDLKIRLSYTVLYKSLLPLFFKMKGWPLGARRVILEQRQEAAGSIWPQHTDCARSWEPVSFFIIIIIKIELPRNFLLKHARACRNCFFNPVVSKQLISEQFD